MERPHSGRLLGAAAPLLLVVLAATALGAARLVPPPTVTVPVSAVTGGAPNAAPADLKAAAADLLAATTAKGGTGYRFEIVQRSTLEARAGGRAPAGDGYLIGLVETGYVLPSGLYLEMRSGPATAAEAADPAGGELMFQALVTGGTTYRNDGDGWYKTSTPPGIGLDPATAAALPRLLRNSTGAKDTTLAAAAGELGAAGTAGTRAITATGTVPDFPGVVAVDGAPFTRLSGPLGLTFDAAGRLAGILALAQNTNVTAYDLMVTTEIAIRYDTVPTVLPRPEPAFTGSTTPVSVP